VLQAVIPPENFLLISRRLDLRIQVATRGCRQSGGNRSDHFLITKPLFNLLPFGRTLSPVTFYQYIDYQLPNLVEQASNNLLYWNVSRTQHFNGDITIQLTLFFDNTFLWHYYVPAKHQEITQSLYDRHRV